jgi:succinyldiaminopimelate transaminase
VGEDIGATSEQAAPRYVPAPFVPPAYPYDRLSDYATLAEALPGGLVDCSIGTPFDPPPPAVIQALATSGTERGYPASIGSADLRTAARGWMARRFDVELGPDQLAACVGTKEFVASTAQYLHRRHPDRDTVLYPAVAYPTYAMGATLAGCRAVAVPPATADGSGLDLAAVDTQDVDRALLLWTNSPSNPTGGLTELGPVADWGRTHGVPVFSDECYAEFTWASRPRSILEHGTDGVVAVHSLSKRSNLAGIRAGFFAGDPDLVVYLREVRRHAGLMVPGPVQAAAAVAFDDDRHVAEQRSRYLERLTFLSAVLTDAGCPVGLPDGGFYLWLAVPERWSDPWALAEALARDGGLLVSPSDLYGEPGLDHVRIAVVQPMDRLELVADRLVAAGWGR